MNSYIPEPNDLIQPRNILFSFGSDTYTLKKGKEAFEDTDCHRQNDGTDEKIYR